MCNVLFIQQTTVLLNVSVVSVWWRKQWIFASWNTLISTHASFFFNYLKRLGSRVYFNAMLSILPSPSFETLMMMLPGLGVHCVLPASLVLLSPSLVPYRMMCVSPILPTPREKLNKKIITHPAFLNRNFKCWQSTSNIWNITALKWSTVTGREFNLLARHYRWIVFILNNAFLCENVWCKRSLHLW